MSPHELRATLFRLGLPQTRVAQCLGVDSRTVRYWLEGERDVPPLVSAVLAMAEDKVIDLAEVHSYLSVGFKRRRPA